MLCVDITWILTEQKNSDLIGSYGNDLSYRIHMTKILPKGIVLSLHFAQGVIYFSIYVTNTHLCM